MSTWTNEKHEAAREVVTLIAEARTVSSSLRELAITLADALDEIERLRAHPTITNDMIERAAQAIWQSFSLCRGGTPLPDPDSTNANDAGAGRRYRRAATAALTAALADTNAEGHQQ